MSETGRPDYFGGLSGLRAFSCYALIVSVTFLGGLSDLSPYFGHKLIPIVFLPAAMSFALFASQPRKYFPWIGSAVLIGMLTGLYFDADFDAPHLLIIILTLVESIIAASVVRRFSNTDQPLAHARDVNRFILANVAVPICFGVLTLSMLMMLPGGDHLQNEGSFSFVFRWFLSHGTSYLVFGAVFWLALRSGTYEFFGSWWLRRRLAFLATLTVLGVSALIMAATPLFSLGADVNSSLALLFLPMPWLMIMAGAYQTGGAAVAALVYATLTIYPASTGWGTIWGENPGDNIASMQLYIGMPCSAAFVLAAFVRMVKDRNRRLKRLNQELQTALAQADESRNAKANFLAMMSHELRTPLNAVIGFSELIKEQSFGPIRPSAYANLGANIHSSGQRLLSMIEGMLYATDDDKLIAEFDKGHIHFVKVIGAAVSAIGEEAATRNITIHVKADLPLAMAADERALRQILYNVLENAVRHCPEGSVVKVILSADGANSIIRIIDGGPGFDVSDWERGIKMPPDLGPFPTPGRGSGSGLAIARALAYGHGGHIALSSVQGQGTIVTITFYATHDASSPLVAVA